MPNPKSHYKQPPHVTTDAQGVAAQRVFGGRERFVAWREAGVGTLPGKFTGL